MIKINIEHIAQAIDPKTKHVMYQSAGPDEKVLIKWFKDKAHAGKFAGLECHIHKRYLINGRPFHVEQKHILWLLIGVQFIFIVWKLSR